ncbi:MAG: hypothetical protein CUN55_10175 [Phototrophicales bacterium]|nr:MAG: hypothetical protein CUN55_10175 [Phototrophicales bacterium]
MSQDKRLQNIDRMMNEIRDALSWTSEEREVNELKALQLLLEITRELHERHEIHERIQLILDSVIAFADADRAFLILIDDQGQQRYKMGRDSQGQFISHEQFTPSQGVIERTLERKRTLLVPDAQIDSELSKRQSIQELHLRTIMCAPLSVQEKIIGLLYVDSQHSLGQYSSAHVNVIASLADQAAVAIRNAEKFDTKT